MKLVHEMRLEEERKNRRFNELKLEEEREQEHEVNGAQGEAAERDEGAVRLKE